MVRTARRPNATLRRSRLAAPLVMLAMLVGCGGRAGATDTAGAMAVAAGIGGAWRTGSWTPVVVTMPATAEAEPGHVRVWAEDADGQLVAAPATALARTDGGASARFRVRFGRPTGRLVVERLPPDGTAGHGAPPAAPATTIGGEHVPSDEGVTLAYGDLPALPAASRLADRAAGTKTRVIAVDPRQPPVAGAAALDYDLADTIVVCGGVVPELAADTRAGIDAWTRQGGRLVVLAGASALPIAAGGGPAADWLPGGSPRLVPLRKPTALEAYARSGGLATRLPVDGLPVPLFTVEPSTRGTVDAFEGARESDLPLVVRRGHGLGSVTWIGVDVDAAPLRDWPGMPSLLLALVGGRTRDDEAAPPRGVPDLAAQLRIALDRFLTRPGGPPAAAVPFEVIAALGLAYVAALYPLHWRLATRPGAGPWTPWVVLPVLAAMFTGLAWGAAAWWRPAGGFACRTAELLDVDAASGLVRGSSWAAAHAPVNDRIDVAVAPPAATAGPAGTVAVSWFAPAGRGFGGIDGAVAHPALASDAYAYGDSLADLERVPIAAAASLSFEAEWSGPCPQPPVDAALTCDDQGILHGTLAQHLPITLADCWLAHAGWRYDVGRLPPGVRYDVDAGRGPRSLASALTRRRAAKDRDVAVRWDPADVDVARILEVAGFHQAAGGSAFTGLPAGRLRRLDLSPQLSLHRAVLVGVPEEPSSNAAWRLAAEQGGEAVAAVPATRLCRIVIPLSRTPEPSSR